MSTQPNQIPLGVFETSRGLIIRADLTDTSEHEVRVMARGDELTIAGHHATASVRLPGPVDASRIVARYSGSRLIINVPLMHPDRVPGTLSRAPHANIENPLLAPSRA